jgi:hypothetical protein
MLPSIITQMSTKAPKDSSVVTLLSKIDFSPDNVVGAAADQALLFVEAIQFRLSCLEKRSDAKMAWERIKAETELNIRKEYRDLGSKITEGNIDSLTLLDKSVSAAAKAYAEADVYDEYSKLVVEAFRMRRDCLRIVDDMTRDEVGLQRAAETGAEKMRDSRRKLRDRFPGA